MAPHPSPDDHDEAEHGQYHTATIPDTPSGIPDAEAERISLGVANVNGEHDSEEEFEHEHTHAHVAAPERLNSSTALFPKKPQYGRDGSRRYSNPQMHEESQAKKSKRGIEGLNATLGLVIHAMADGVALGASSLSKNGELGLVVFLAVIIHKGEWQQISYLSELGADSLLGVQVRPRWVSQQL